MSAIEILEDIRRLPTAEQLEVVERIRAEFGKFDDKLTPEQIVELERRAEDARRNPGRGKQVEQVFADIEERLRANK